MNKVDRLIFNFTVRLLMRLLKKYARDKSSNEAVFIFDFKNHDNSVRVDRGEQKYVVGYKNREYKVSYE